MPNLVADRLRFEEHAGEQVASLVGAELAVSTEQDAVDLIGNASFAGARGLLLEAGQLAPEFFDLTSGLAGAVLQKAINYRLKLAVLLPTAKERGGALSAFINESNEGNHVRFLSDRGAALDWLASD